MNRLYATVAALFTAAFFACFLLWPIGQALRGAFFDANGAFTPAYLVEVLRNPIYLDGLSNAFLLAVASTTLTVAIALPLAFLADRFLFPGKALFSAVLLVPMILPPFVGAIGIKQILGQTGALNVLLWHIGILHDGHTIDWLGRGRFWGVVALNALHLYPVLYLNVVAALANVDPAMEEAAENLGCTGLRKFLENHAAAHHAGTFRGRNDRVHLGVHRAGRAADVRLHARHAGADFLRHQGNRGEPVPLRAGRGRCSPVPRCSTSRANFPSAARTMR